MAGINPYPQEMPPAQTALVDSSSGAATKDGRYLWLALWSRTGEGDGVPRVAPNLVVVAGSMFNIVADWNEFITVPPGGGCLLPPLKVGTDCIIWNDDANSIDVNPQPNQQIDALGLGARYPLAAGKMQWFRCITPTLIKSMQLG